MIWKVRLRIHRILSLIHIYAAMAQKYKKVFFPNTIINGMNASGRTVAEVKEMIAGGIENYVLTIEEREGCLLYTSYIRRNGVVSCRDGS